MNALVRASDDETQARVTGYETRRSLALKRSLVIFAYSLAGHETTANRVAYALILLATHPHYQEWIREEIHQVGKSVGTVYNSAFPRLKRCLAVMVN